MWQQAVEEVFKMQKMFGDMINPGISMTEAACLKNLCKDKFGFSLPEEYCEVLRCFNGIEFNGYVLYSADADVLREEPQQTIAGVLEMNDTWHENGEFKKYLFLGESSLSWYVYEPERNAFLELDLPSGEVEKEYMNFDEMFSEMLKECIS